jgi:basic membrane lipoprotein Med (substrate-binding protein (PBP1-ABC) superfamily)
MLVAAAGLVAAGCGAPADTPSSSPRVELIIAGTVPERWQQDVRAGIGRIAVELGTEVRAAVAASEADRRRLVHAAAVERRADVVFCVGDGFAPLVLSQAAGQSDTRFVVVPGRGYGHAVTGLDFRTDGVGYLAGVLAAMLSDGDVVGVLLGGTSPWLTGAEEGFLEGFASTRSAVEVVHGQGPDAPWELVARAVDVALYVADEPERSVLSAAHDAGLQLIVSEPRVLDTDPEVALAAVVVDVPEAMVRITRDALEGRIREPDRRFDLSSGVVNLQLGPLLTRSPDPALHEVLESARAEVTEGFVELESLGM